MRRMVVFNHTLALGLLVLLMVGTLYIAPWRDKSGLCSSCHLEWSQAAFAKPASSEIPRYPGLTWTAPMPLPIWRGETWTPEDPSFREIVVAANIPGGLTGSTVWEYYRKEMPRMGWQLISAQPPLNPAEFKATFAKKGRQCILWFRCADDQAGGSNSGVLEIFYTDKT